MQNIKAIIVDDEENNRASLSHLIKIHTPHVEIVAFCASAQEAREAIVKHKPNLLFLDIKMPQENGFELLDSLEHINFEVIFTTAFDEYGVRAVKASALDYLLKPIKIAELIKAVQKAWTVIGRKYDNARMEHLIQNLKEENPNKTIALSLTDSIEFVEIKSILRCESDDNYTTFHLKNNQKHLVSKTLKEFDELLSPSGFLRVHQSHLINLSEVKSFVKKEGGYILMKDNSQIPISRQRRESVLQILTKTKSPSSF